jgi:hypothetical protein
MGVIMKLTPNVKYYKLKLLKNLINETSLLKQQLLSELVTNATDPVIVTRRIRMLLHVNQYEAQLISKIQLFETDDYNDINVNPQVLFKELAEIVNRSA